MKIILTSRVSGLGQVGDIVEVKNGYAKNFLIPSDKAIVLTKNNEKAFEEKRKEYEKASDNIKQIAQSAKTKLLAKNIVIIENASDDGRLYGSVNSALIAKKISEYLGDDAISKNDVVLEKPIKEIGVHKIKVDLHSDVEFFITLVISRSESEVEAVIKADERARKEARNAEEAESNAKISVNNKEENKEKEDPEL